MQIHDYFRTNQIHDFFSGGKTNLRLFHQISAKLATNCQNSARITINCRNMNFPCGWYFLGEGIFFFSNINYFIKNRQIFRFFTTNYRNINFPRVYFFNIRLFCINTLLFRLRSQNLRLTDEIWTFFVVHNEPPPPFFLHKYDFSETQQNPFFKYNASNIQFEEQTMWNECHAV